MAGVALDQETPQQPVGGPEAPAGRAARRIVEKLADAPFILPVVVIIGIIILVPTVTAIYYSFTNWNPGYSSPFVGLTNYTQLLKSSNFHEILTNELFLLLGLPVWVFLPLAAAFLLHTRVPGAKWFRTFFFFPSTASPALIGILFTAMLFPGGPLDAFLGALGIHSPPDWLVNTAWVKPVLIGVLLWATMGVGLIIYSAGLGAVPPELFEVAELDGASWWQQLWYVVLPSLIRLVELWSIILVIVVFVGMFPWVYTLTRGGPGYTSTTIDYDIYQNSLTFGYFGLAAAEMVIMLVLIAVILSLGKLALSRTRRW